MSHARSWDLGESRSGALCFPGRGGERGERGRTGSSSPPRKVKFMGLGRIFVLLGKAGMASSTNPRLHPPLLGWRLYISTHSPSQIHAHPPATYLQIFSLHSSRAHTFIRPVLPLSAHFHPSSPAHHPLTQPHILLSTHPSKQQFFRPSTRTTSHPSFHTSFSHLFINLPMYSIFSVHPFVHIATHLYSIHISTHFFTYLLIHSHIHPLFLARIGTPS